MNSQVFTNPPKYDFRDFSKNHMKGESVKIQEWFVDIIFFDFTSKMTIWGLINESFEISRNPAQTGFIEDGLKIALQR